MKVAPTKIPDVLAIEPEVFADERGFFMETWHRQKLSLAGLDFDFVQDNQSTSRRGTLRGLHYQIRQAQGKLVRVSAGEVFDVAVDLRRSSPTYGEWVGVRLSGDNKRLLWVPPGFAHGFYVTSASATFLYKCTDFYSREHERTIRWDDPTLGIEWPLAEGGEPALSEKDRQGVPFHEAEHFS